jgi:hypothetical protein
MYKQLCGAEFISSVLLSKDRSIPVSLRRRDLDRYFQAE